VHNVNLVQYCVTLSLMQILILEFANQD